MQTLYTAEAADKFVKNSWLVRPADEELDGAPAGAVAFALFIGPEAERRARDYAAGLERGRLRLIDGGRSIAVPPLPTLTNPTVEATH